MKGPIKKLVTATTLMTAGLYTSQVFAFTVSNTEAFYDLYSKVETLTKGPLGATVAVGAVGFGFYQLIRQGNIAAGVPALMGGAAIPAVFPIISSLGLSLSAII
jgi:hypothetical protein